MEGLSYEQVLNFTRSWDVVYFTAMFAIVLGYALWPSNKKRFDDAARIPLDEGEN